MFRFCFVSIFMVNFICMKIKNLALERVALSNEMSELKSVVVLGGNT